MRIGGRIIVPRRRRWGSRRILGIRTRPKASKGWKSGGSGRKAGGSGGWKPASGPPRREVKSNKKLVWLIAILVFLILFIQMFAYVEKKMEGPLIELAKIRVKQIATESLNEAITEQVANGKQYGDLVDWKTDSNGKITGFMLNYKAHMEITSETVQTVKQTLNQVSKLNEKIPLGQALGSTILASFGPRIPIRIEPQSDVKVDLNTRRQDAGINMILVEVYLHIKTEVSVIVPLNMGPQAVETDIPVSYLLVVGDVPMYYYDNKGQPVGENGSNAPSLALPSEQAEQGDSAGASETPAETGSMSGSGSGSGASSNSRSGANSASNSTSGAADGSGGNSLIQP
ncbi:sporulation protein YunB [Paenibacillus pinistramenti]|uniref:sporulation protein YunB n=1 Tax=Paenibacillus pinistramenti TaxID=1768003 RepID=UPI001109D103|nr:sporulation protein YunB [Paenibacillus pinistramenti]